ncbi:dienelactone hydrolase family protein [Rhodoferax sp.]|uniref:dienelactone hydrolase family protein n=1 Tax=Rhodoferax sp. TaxID=50421 RepID=UPI00374CF84B
MKHILRTLLFTAAALLATVATLAGAQQLARDTQGRIEYNSFTPKNMFELAREHRQNWAPQKVWGDLSLPQSSEATVPAMVLMHGSGGIEKGMAQWVDAFNSIGVATFVVSSFEPRGVKRTAEDQSLVPASATLADGLLALQLLATHPRIDAKRIGVMGFSRGGSDALRSAVEPLRNAVLKTDLKFALHIAAYAGCNQVYWSPNTTRAPILMLTGKDDDYVGAEPCEQLAKKYFDTGSRVHSVTYFGAGHSWDGTYPVFFLPNATSGLPCGVVRWDIDSWTITAERSGNTIAPDQLGAFFNGCVQRGVHVGRNEQAFRQSRSDAQAFVRSIFFATP